MCPPIIPVRSRLSGFLALFLAGLTSLSAQESRRNSVSADVNLVQVNIRAESRALPEALEISGVRIPGYRPTVVHLFPATGVVIDDRGHVLAFLGYRWVDLGGSDLQVDVEASGGRRVPAKLVGIDQSLGVALVSSPDSGLKRTPLCEYCEVRDGTRILAPVDERPGFSRLGSATVLSVQTAPKGFARGEWLVTVDRPLLGIGEPLLDSSRRVIGFVATQMRSASDLVSAQAVVYPISQLLNSASKILRSGGDIRTGWLGVFLEDSAQKPGQGVAVNRVEPESPADKAGLQSGDVVMKWDGHEVSGVREFIRSVQDSSVGSKVAIDILRQGRPAQLVATIEARRSQRIAGRLVFDSRRGEMVDLSRPLASSGLQMMALTPQLALFFQVPGQSGVLVVDVDPESPFARAGIMAGDVIFAVDAQRVRDPQSLTNYLQTQSGPQRVVLRTVRRGTERSTSVEIQAPAAPGLSPRKP
jgi:serine protease Do